MPLSALSIAIPTYNRGPYLIRILDHIYSLFPPTIEVCIRDNASSDNTEELALNWIRQNPDKLVKYHRNTENIGIDFNIIAVCKDCSSTWIKIFGDDDSFDPQIVQRIDEFLATKGKANYSVCFFNYYEVSADLKTRHTERQLPIYKDKSYEEGQEIIADVGEPLSLISGILIEKEPFLKSCTNIPKLVATGGIGFIWAMLDMLKTKKALFISDPLIGWANGEPERGFSWRRTVVKDLQWIVNDRCPKYLNRVKKRTLTSHITPRMRSMMQRGDSWTDRMRLVGFLIKYYWDIPSFWFQSLPRILIPTFIYRAFKS